MMRTKSWLFFEPNSAVWHAIYSGYLSLFSGFVEFSLSVSTGHSENSMSLFGLAIMAIAEMTGSLLVIWRWQFATHYEMAEAHVIQFEIKCSILIGTLTWLLGLVLAVCSFAKVIMRPEPAGTIYGILVGLFGGIASISLYAYKSIVGNQLNSIIILADARCSYCVAVISLAALVALAADGVFNWADGVMGLVVAIYTMQQGYFQIRESNEKLNMRQDLADEKAHLLKRPTRGVPEENIKEMETFRTTPQARVDDEDITVTV